MTPINTPEVSVCVCAFKRPLLLMQLLKSLATQTLALSRFEVIVVDNDPAASAKAVIQEAAQSYPELLVRYEIEPLPGISFARNKTVALAKGELLAFIDDDEWAASNWLSDLVGNMTGQIDAVLGPVIPQYPAGTRSWVIKSGFFERPRFVTGTLIGSRHCRTGNALVKAGWLKSRQPAAFDLRFAHTGGEDYDFFQWLETRGGRFIWCDTAVVNEAVPLARQSLNFVFERCFRTSIRYWREAYAVHPQWWIVHKASAGLIGGAAFVLIGALVLPFSAGKAVQLCCKGVKGFGRAAALTNKVFVGYGQEQ